MPTNSKSKDEVIFKFSGQEAMSKVKAKVRDVRELIAEGRAQKIVVTSKDGRTLLDVSLGLAIAGAVFAPIITVISALVATYTECTITVVKRTEAAPKAA